MINFYIHQFGAVCWRAIKSFVSHDLEVVFRLLYNFKLNRTAGVVDIAKIIQENVGYLV